MGLQRVTRLTRVTRSVHIAAAGRSVGAKKQPVLQSAASPNWDGCLFAGPQLPLVTTAATSHSDPRTRLWRRASHKDSCLQLVAYVREVRLGRVHKDAVDGWEVQLPSGAARQRRRRGRANETPDSGRPRGARVAPVLLLVARHE